MVKSIDVERRVYLEGWPNRRYRAHVRQENLRRARVGDPLTNRKWFVRTRVGLFESRTRAFIEVRGALTKAGITPPKAMYYTVPYHVTIPLRAAERANELLATRRYRHSVRLQRWSQGMTGTAYNVVGGSLFHVLRVLRAEGLVPAASEWHVSM